MQTNKTRQNAWLRRTLLSGSAMLFAVVLIGRPAVPASNDGTGGVVSGLDYHIGKAQTFEIGVSGKLTRVDVKLSQTTPNPTVPDPGPGITFDIRPTDPNGNPVANNASALAVVTIPDSDIPLTWDWVKVKLAKFKLNINAGDRLAIVLRGNDDGTPQNHTHSQWQGGFDTYAAGSAYFRNPDPAGGPWTAQPDIDMYFRTFPP